MSEQEIVDGRTREPAKPRMPRGAIKAARVADAGKRSETSLVKACLSLLEARGVFAFRCNTGAAKIGNRFIRFGTPGCADILAVGPQGRLWAIEVKVGRNPLSDDQRRFKANIERSGGFYIEVRDSIDGLESAITGTTT
jgi:hypothetical protein